MIEIQNVTKTFGTLKALDDVTVNIKPSSIYGLIGSNGSGKSTLMKILSGAYRCDCGTVSIDGEPILDNPDVKKDIIYLSDEQYYLKGANIEEMRDFYRAVYPNFDLEYFKNLLGILKLDPRKKINTFSKGMMKQTSVLLGLASRPKILLCDETFDGLDPVIRQYVKRLLATNTADHGTTTIIASHSLRELEDFCDHVGMLHKGGIMFERDLDDLKTEIHNYQLTFGVGSVPLREDFTEFDVVSYKTIGSLVKITIRGDREETLESLKAKKPIFLEGLPLTLEEVFIEEMEGKGYVFDDLAKQ
ncbi:ABC transporter ATP-binding protein YtrB [Clostridia bacterium]|nr:ABC transporter ATP-binding protein YtrB [Clostridia bacterium]